MSTLVGERFEIEREAGAGAFARVYRARDISTDATVALKILNTASDHTLRRFAREVSALGELDHPGIVRYVAHGTTGTGQAFLAMEWLDGESLQDRIDRGALSVAESVALGRGLASALGAAHARGLVHRDVKPANIFLVGRDAARPKLLDFGLARDTLATLGLTATGDLLGTPLYMAPEQASCELDVDARVDVYALGAVLYACLAGRPPLVAPNLVALLAKIVVDEPPPLSVLVPGLPPGLVDLIGRMLAKSRAARPADGGEAEAALARAPATDAAGPATRATVVPLREQRVVSILLASDVNSSAALDATLGAEGGAMRLADGSTIVIVSGPESPVDLASRAARHALRIRSETGSVAIATGRALVSGPMPVGEVIDRAASQLGHAKGAIRADSETASLIEGRFELARDSQGALVVGERAGQLDPVRTLLGKPTRCFGREREIAAVEGFFSECVAESAARAVIVIGDVGIGKSRLAREVLQRLSSHADQPRVLVARCAPQTQSSPFVAVAALLRSGGDDARKNEFLAELLGEPSATPSERMLAARENPALMFDQIRAAWVTWLRELCGQPVVVCIEDIHWLDESSLQLLDASLGALAELPLLVLALARPEIKERAQPVLAARRPHQVRLDPLSKRSAERLVREALGDHATDALVADILARADGNALFLEELVRAASQATLSALPVGVIGAVQVRLDAMRPETRAILRIASVYGERFTRTEVEALVAPSADVGSALRDLISEEVIVESSDGFAFRHALVREAAYELLPDDDRVLAHALAGAHLEHEAHAEPAVVAQHFERGRQGERAAHWFTQAATRALERNDLAGAIAHARHAQELVDDATAHARLDLVIAECEWWRGHHGHARDAALRAAIRLPEAATEWFQAAGLVITSAGQLGDNEIVETWLRRVSEHTPGDAARSEFVLCLARASSQFAWSDRTDLGRLALHRADEVSRAGAIGPFAAARLEFARAYDHAVDGVHDACQRSLSDAIALFERVGADRDALQTRMVRAMMKTFSSGGDETRDELRQCVVDAERADARYLAEWARFELALCLLLRGERTEAWRELDAVPEAVKMTPLFRAGRAVTECWAAFVADDVDHVATVLATMDGVVIAKRYRAALSAATAWLTFQRDRGAGVRAALAALDELDAAPGMKADVHDSGHAVALHVLVRGGAPEAGQRLAAQIQRLTAIGARFTDDAARHAFLHVLPWNRLSFELSRGRP